MGIIYHSAITLRIRLYEGITPIESYDLGMGLEPEKKILFLGGDWFLQFGKRSQSWLEYLHFQ